MANKTRKNRTKISKNTGQQKIPIINSKKTRRMNGSFAGGKHTNAKKGTQLKCLLKTSKAKIYKSVYGVSTGGSIRSNIGLFN